jgi:hypothetical protein
LEEEAERRANRKEHVAQPHVPEPEPIFNLEPPNPTPEPLEEEPDIPGAFSASIEDMDNFMFAGSANSNSDESLPKTLREAYSGAEVELWKSAVEEELQSLNSNHVYETVLIPEGITPITSKPIFRIKRDQRENMEQYKVRIVARGFTQKAGVDY